MFSVDDYGYEKAQKYLDEVEENTFHSRKGNSLVHFAKREEILSLLTLNYSTALKAEG
jgi:hypothetical protein